MGKMLSDGNRKMVYVPALADYHAPTAAELTDTSALQFQCLVSAANFTLGASGEDSVDDQVLCSTSNSKSPGRVNYEAGMNFIRYDTTLEDKAWSLFVEKGIDGYIVQRIGKNHEDPFVVGDEVQVYEIITGTPMIQTPEAGQSEKFRLNFYVQDKVDERAVVAA